MKARTRTIATYGNGSTVSVTDWISDKEQYEEDLKRRQEEHLRMVKQSADSNWRPCLHDACSQCFGTGVKRDGTPCIHNISCPCPKCSPIF